MGTFEIILIVSVFLCALVAGFLFAFAIVVMPGIKNLPDDQFIRAFQVMDRVIQNNQPVFLLVWVGSVLTLVAAYAAGFNQLDTTSFWLLSFCLVMYVFGVHAPTVIINIPLNNRLQAVELGDDETEGHHTARQTFESRWNRANHLRTCLSCVVVALLLVVLLRL